jgi:hypothetical protein
MGQLPIEILKSPLARQTFHFESDTAKAIRMLNNENAFKIEQSLFVQVK